LTIQESQEMIDQKQVAASASEWSVLSASHSLTLTLAATRRDESISEIMSRNSRHLSSQLAWCFVFALGWAFLPAVPVLAQDFDRIAPRVPKPTREAKVEGASNEDLNSEDAEADAIELVPELKGLVFVPLVSEVRVDGRPGVSGVLVEGVDLMDQAEWQKKLSDRIGAPLSFGGLNAILKEVILYYRAEGRPVVDVVVAEQDITSGVVQLAVIEARLGEVRTEGGRWFKAERLAGQVRLKPGDPILSTILMADLAWLNKNPFRSVDLVYMPGPKDGETDVVLRIDDRNPMRVYGGYEDSGNELTGQNRFYGGVNYGNLWGLDHIINYQWTFNDEIDRLRAHSLSYIVPLPWRHTFTFYGAYVLSDTNLPPPLDLSGATSQLSGRYNIPLPDPSFIKKNGAFEHEIELGYDFKDSTSNLEFGLAQAFNTATDIHQFSLAYIAGLRDSLGGTSLRLAGYYSPGNLEGNNDDTSYQLVRAGANSTYFYGNIELERATRLIAGFTSVVRGTAQFADENLLPSEQLGFGGYRSVRGYEENEALTDQGYLLTTEIRAPAFSVLPGDTLHDELQLLAFWDYASGRNVNLLPGEASSTQLSSVGPGFRWTIGEHFSMRFDYGFQLRESGQNLGLGDSRMHIGGTVSY